MREIFGGDVQLCQQHLGLGVVRLHAGQRGKPLEPLFRGLVRLDRGEGTGQIGVRLHVPRFFQHAGRIFRFALIDIAMRRHHGCGDQIGGQAVRLDRGLAGFDAVPFGNDVFRLGQGEHGIATFMHVTRHLAVLELGVQRLARTGPIFFLGLQFQQHIASFGMFRFDGKSFLGQLQRGFRVAFGQLLFHDPAHTDKAGAFVGDQLAIGLFCLATVARHFRGLRDQQIGQVRTFKVFIRLCGLGHRQTPFAAGQRH